MRMNAKLKYCSSKKNVKFSLTSFPRHHTVLCSLCSKVNIFLNDFSDVDLMSCRLELIRINIDPCFVAIYNRVYGGIINVIDVVSYCFRAKSTVSMNFIFLSGCHEDQMRHF